MRNPGRSDTGDARPDRDDGHPAAEAGDDRVPADGDAAPAQGHGFGGSTVTLDVDGRRVVLTQPLGRRVRGMFGR